MYSRDIEIRFTTNLLTKELEVTYAIPEDNKRKANSMDKYKKMAQRHPKLFRLKFFKWLMKQSWGKTLLFFFFGKKRITNRCGFAAGLFPAE